MDVLVRRGARVRPRHPVRDGAHLVGVLGHSTVSADPSGVTALLQSMTDSSPVVVVVDDAHLADEDSLVAVTLAARHLAGRPLLVIFASRSRPWMTGERLFATIGPS